MNVLELEDEGYGETGHQPDERHGQADLAEPPELDAEPDSLIWHACLRMLEIRCLVKAHSDKLQIYCDQRLVQAVAVKIEIFPIICSDLTFCDSHCNLQLV